MPTAPIAPQTPRKPLRLWPGVVAVVLLVLVRMGLPLLLPDDSVFGVIGGVVGALAIVVWWTLFSRAPWSERLGALALMVAALLATSYVVDESISNGMNGMMLPFFSVPVMSIALVAAAAASRGLSSGPRRAVMAVAICLACGVFVLLRTGGITGGGNSDLHWRWTPTPEQRLLAQGGDESVPSARGGPAALPSTPAVTTTPETPLVARASDTPAASASLPATGTRDVTTVPPVPATVDVRASWPGFRGPHRDSIVRGVRITTDWSASPPVRMWHRPIGPGWSSFAVSGDLLYTQEQRGEDEVVAAYSVTTGEPVWRHRDPVRFWESNGGAGPRGTPTLSNGRVYAMGATGILKALDAATGAVVWSRNAATDTGRTVPEWGIASSPLVLEDLVIAAVSGTLTAYDRATGQPRWVGPAHGGSYSSPHLVTIDGVPQILMLSGDGAASVAPADGKMLWEQKWDGVTIVQPAVIADGDLLITTASAMGGIGMRRIAVARGPAGWTVDERWTSNGLKPYFNDFVVHDGHAFGFDGSILSCINLKDGSRAWKGGRYGNGQLLLLADQDVLLVLSEEGELALVKATPDQFTELARFPALDGKTWNHPVLVGDILLVRNGEEMAAFRLQLTGPPTGVPSQLSRATPPSP